MKIGGVDPSTLPIEEILVLPRGDQQIVFRATGVPDYDEFLKLCPEPKPPGKLVPSEGWVPNKDDPGYKSLKDAYDSKRLAWMVIKSLEPSEIEWDTVDPDNPSTWLNWDGDLKNAGMTQVECNRVMGLVFQANCLDEAKLAKAREVFVLGQQPVPSEFSGQATGATTTQSGGPVEE